MIDAHATLSVTDQSNLPAPERTPFLANINVQHEPRAQLSRYFLKADSDLTRKALKVFFITPQELIRINEQNASSWAPLMPVLDSRLNKIAPSDLISIAVYDTNDDVVSTISVRRMDIETSVKEEMESLRFFYGDGAEPKRRTDEFTLTSPTASRLKGNIFYLGGLWVRPDQRHNALPVTMTRVIRYLALGSWNPDFEIGIATNAFLRPDVAKIYAFQSTEPEFTFKIDGQLRWRGVFVSSDRAANLQNLQDDIDAMEQLSLADSRSHKKMGS
jgi:hypothetical protein